MATHVLRQLASSTIAAAATSAAEPEVPFVTVECGTDNEYDGRIGLRVSAIFVILVGSLLGAVFPVFAKRHQGVKVPEWAFFVAKYFGSGVIIATAFIHLLAPANEALTSPCLEGPITEYTWVEGIVLMTIFLLFLIEVLAMRFATFSHSHSHTSTPTHSHSHSHAHAHAHSDSDADADEAQTKRQLAAAPAPALAPTSPERKHSQVPGDDHLSHSREHMRAEAREAAGGMGEDYAAQLTAIFILEFGVIFHSIFIGLTLAVAGAEFNTLYVVLVFHQTFEGLGLGSRLAAAPWPARRRWTPYILAGAYALSTPIAIAVGLGLRETYAPGSPTALIANGVFDAVSAGILIYTGLVELMAHEFMFSTYMRRASLRVVLAAFAMMCLGAGLMALLGKWA